MALTSLLSVALGIGLAAATGLRVFLPLLIAAVAARFGVLPLASGFEWLASNTAILMLGSASVLEVAAYYVPGIDHLLDVLASPATLVAGTIVSASVMTNIPPWVLWPVAVIAGGGIAGLTKGATALVRVKSATTTAGLANPLVATVETAGATVVSLVAILVPVLAVLAIGLLLYFAHRVAKKAKRLVFGPRTPPGQPPRQAATHSGGGTSA